jgi:hypothetical protein
MASLELNSEGGKNVCGHISPIDAMDSTKNDIDFYKLTLDKESVVVIETFDLSGVGCDDSTSTKLEVRVGNKEGMNTSPKESESSVGISTCAATSLFLAKSESLSYYFVGLSRGETAMAAFPYLLKTRLPEFKLKESADDAKNNDKKTPEQIGALTRGYFFVEGYRSADDVDYFSFSAPGNSLIRAEIVSDRTDTSCSGNAIKSKLELIQLVEANGTLTEKPLAQDNNSGLGNCSLIDGTGTVPRHPTAKNATDKEANYLLGVSGIESLSTFGYKLVISISTPPHPAPAPP